MFNADAIIRDMRRLFGIELGMNTAGALTHLLTQARNEALEEAAQLAEDIDSGRYTATKTAAQAIRALKVGE